MDYKKATVVCLCGRTRLFIRFLADSDFQIWCSGCLAFIDFEPVSSAAVEDRYKTQSNHNLVLEK